MSVRHVDGHIEVNEEAARQGQTGMHVRYILVFSTLLAALGFGLVAVFTP